MPQNVSHENDLNLLLSQNKTFFAFINQPYFKILSSVSITVEFKAISRQGSAIIITVSLKLNKNLTSLAIYDCLMRQYR